MDTEIEERIRARAYQFWVDEGWPSGRELDHWIRAVEAIAAEEGRPIHGADGPGATAEQASPAAKSASKGARAGARGKASAAEAPATEGAPAGATEAKPKRSTTRKKT